MAVFVPPFSSDCLSTMRKLLSVGIVLFLLAPSSVLGQIEKKVSSVDETVRLVSTDMRALATASYPGHASYRAEYEKPSDGEATWRLSFYGFTDDTTSMNAASEVRFQVDGQPVSPAGVTSESRLLNDQLLEIKHVDFSRSTFQQIATAEKVIASIGSFEFELLNPSRNDLRLILDRVPEDGGGPPVTDNGSNS